MTPKILPPSLITTMELQNADQQWYTPGRDRCRPSSDDFRMSRLQRGHISYFSERGSSESGFILSLQAALAFTRKESLLSSL